MATGIAADTLKNVGSIVASPFTLAGEAIGSAASAVANSVGKVNLDTYLMSFPFMMYYRL